jgi:hypothetical protein
MGNFRRWGIFFGEPGISEADVLFTVHFFWVDEGSSVVGEAGRVDAVEAVDAVGYALPNVRNPPPDAEEVGRAIFMDVLTSHGDDIVHLFLCPAETTADGFAKKTSFSNKMTAALPEIAVNSPLNNPI